MKFILLMLGITSCLFNCSNPNTTLYVGTYTNGDSEGIYQFQFNTETGELSNKHLAATSENPSFLTYSPDKKHIYAVNENENGAITSFKVEKEGNLTSLNTVSVNGAHPCHVTINDSGDKIVVSNYTGGNASLHSVLNSGLLTEAFQVLDHNIDSIASHVHSAQFFKNDLFISDLGRNAVYQYKLKDNLYTLKSPSIIEIQDNPGPRHFSISKNGAFIYIINEYGSSITSVKKTDNGFKQIDSDSTLDENYKGKNFCADIHLSKDERFLYGSNRGENSIVVFKRNTETGTIDKIQNISTHGDWPRNFTLDPTGKFMLVANQNSANISVFKIDPKTGKLSFLHAIDLPSPVCLLF
ncbi:lactonase family protein [uncultured Algibacter sp.]|uniref:lactonase family protein n=1 Tax=uncultured Algibacter sp. TaxID=298659 RepID=UPI002607DADA|nr:lactonase family protein [uncultured Algibacter sp.]